MIALDLEDPANRRASCDQCRQKKLKCDGAYPKCGRCSTVAEPCKYSARLPMGRPKKRRLDTESEDHNSSSATVTNGTSISSDPGSDIGRIESFDPCFRPSEDLTADMLALVPDTNVDPKLLAFESDPGHQTCACLASIYLSLEEVRKADDLPFTTRLATLRHLTATAAGVIQCQVCPTKFLWAMQNAQLLSTLIVSIAEGYKKIVKSVEDETKRAQDANEAKLLLISESESLNTTPGLPLNLDPLDWQGIAKKGIKSELFGTPHSTTLSFVAMLQLMEDRQHKWHSGSTPIPPGIGHRLPHDKEPHCVSVVKHIKDMIESVDNNLLNSKGFLLLQHWEALAIMCQDDQVPGAPEADHAESESIYSEYASDVSETTSVTSSIFNYQYENGRRYHAYRAGQYLLPNDEAEQERLDIVHHVFTLTLGGEICKTRLDNPQAILDAMEIGEEFPSAEVIGTDLSPIQSQWVPPNVKFEVEDATQDWTFPQDKFDFIHARTLAGAIQDWPALLTQCYHHCKPGGQVEISEGRANFFCDDASLRKDSATYKWLVEFRRLSSPLGFDIAPKLPGMLKEAGFKDVGFVQKVVPMGTWPKDPKLKEIGRWFRVQFLEMGLEAYCLALFTRAGGWSNEEAQVLFAQPNFSPDYQQQKLPATEATSNRSYQQQKLPATKATSNSYTSSLAAISSAGRQRVVTLDPWGWGTCYDEFNTPFNNVTQSACDYYGHETKIVNADLVGEFWPNLRAHAKESHLMEPYIMFPDYKVYIAANKGVFDLVRMGVVRRVSRDVSHVSTNLIWWHHNFLLYDYLSSRTANRPSTLVDMNPFGSFFRRGAEWTFVGHTSSFPDVDDDAGNLAKHRLCNAKSTPGCKAFYVPKEDPSSAAEVVVGDDGLGDPLTDQVLVFQYKGIFHAVDHSCPHSQFPLSNGIPFDIEDFGVALSVGLQCPKHGWSFDVFTGMSDRGNYRLTTWEVEIRDAKEAASSEPDEKTQTTTDKEVWTKIGLLVVIRGGLARPQQDQDIRLRDIVVSQPDAMNRGATQHALRKDTNQDQERMGHVSNPPYSSTEGLTI
ncbi:hypothetical protein F66182_10230 [Fusarium sp. NRRL 66182]|nr:hypothetical protein F66182_10230 [Fusarium sp. NRRL 66182]